MHMVGTTLDVLKGPHMEDNHEEGADLHMPKKSYEEENIGQALIEVERKDEVFFSTIKMGDHIPYGSTNKKGPSSSIDWVDRDPLGMKTVGGKEFKFCNKFLAVNGIVLTCGKTQIFNLHPLDTFHTHAHEVNSDFFVLE